MKCLPGIALLLFICFLNSSNFAQETIPSFPGAEGFGAKATGGRGGEVIYVTNLNESGPGSFLEATSQVGSRYILFKISGEMQGATNWNNQHNIREGNVTIAGQTSPGGIILRGLYSESRYGSGENARENIIIRHIRSRQGVDQDNLRLLDTRNLIVDHCSFAWADDECAQISSTNTHTIQNCIFAETLGAHWDRGGILLKYSSENYFLDSISFHHNMFYRIGDRLPQIDCDDGPCERCDLVGNGINVEVSHNLLWDNASPMYTKDYYLNPWGQRFGAHFNINYINNYSFVRSSFVYGMFVMQYNNEHQIYYHGNRMNIYPDYMDTQLAYCCNHFFNDHPNTLPVAGQIFSPHNFPAVTGNLQGDDLLVSVSENVGAFPRDSMDRRFISHVSSRQISNTHWSVAEADDAFIFDWNTAPLPPLDSDDDGMPDSWEIHNGLNPLAKDHTGKELSTLYTGIEGYDNLECYLNRFSDSLVSGISLTEGTAAIQEFTLTASVPKELFRFGVDNTIDFSITIGGGGIVENVELSLDLLDDPFAFPSGEPVSATLNGNIWQYSYNLREDMLPGKYQVLVHAANDSGANSYALISFFIGEQLTETITLLDQIFTPSANECFGALQNIVVAGDGNIVEFQSGSSVNLIAGQSIQLLSGTQIQYGAYVNAQITTDESFCELFQPSIVSAEPINLKSKNEQKENPDNKEVNKQQSIKVFPNPNNGRFTIEISNFKDGAKIFVYNMLGGVVYSSTLKNMELNYVYLPEIRKGIYFVSVLGENEYLVKKILIN